MRKISGVLLALAASLALGATTVAAKDYGDGGGGGGGGEKMQNEGKGGAGGEKMRCHEAHGDMEHHHRCDRSRHACADRWAGAVRVSVAASGTTAAKKSAVSQTFNGGSSKGGRRLCEHMKPLARRDAARCLASLSLSEHLRGVRISVVSRTSPNTRGSQRARLPS